jgi:hypothetical protein
VDTFHESYAVLKEMYTQLGAILFPWLNNPKMKIENLNDGASGRGYLLSGGDKHMAYLQTTIFTIRNVFQSKLPIEVFFVGSSDLSLANRRKLELMGDNIRCRDLTTYYSSSVEGQNLLSVIGWDVKPFSLVVSSFEEVILLDADIGLLQSPEKLFDTEVYQRTGTYFFTDRSMTGDLLWWDPRFIMYLLNPKISGRACKLPVISGKLDYQMESGVVLVNKRAHMMGLLATCKLLDKDERLLTQKLVWGDKEMYWIGFETVQEQYGFNNYLPGNIGIIRDKEMPAPTNAEGATITGVPPKIVPELCGRMLHVDEQGIPFWWNGGHRFSDKVAKNYPDLPYMKPQVFDDGGFLETDSSIITWRVDFPEWWCMSDETPRGRRQANVVRLPNGQSVEHAASKLLAIYRHFEMQKPGSPPY